LPAVQFGPRALRELRDRWAESGRLCRYEVNRRTRQVVRVFRWGVAEELVPPSTLEALRALEGLRAGRTPARDNEPRRPCTDAQIRAILPHLPKPAASIVRLLRATGMRPDEACRLRMSEVETSGSIWVYRPKEHKTSYRGHERFVPLNSEAQAA